jgi:hypothetical protein
MEGLMVDRSLNDAGTSASLLPSPPPSLLSSSPPNTEQSAYMALQAKGALQAHRPTLQSFSSSFMGGAYLACAPPSPPALPGQRTKECACCEIGHREDAEANAQ